MSYRALVVADDLTGAMDSGSEFATRGAATVVALGGEGSGGGVIESDVLVVDTDSRYASATDAARAVERVIITQPAAIVYKKIDSTLRGNLVPEIDAAISASGADIALLAPAFPATGRTTIEGTHQVDGVPVAETLDRTDRPATSHLPTLLSDSSYPVVTCSMTVVDRGPEAIGERLSSIETPAIVVCDARTEAHLDAISRAGASENERVLSVGSAGFARHVRLPEGESNPEGASSDGKRENGSTDDGSVEGRSAAGRSAENRSADSESIDGTKRERGRGGTRRVLGVAGSANRRTIAQVGTLPAEQVVALDVERAVRDPESAAREASVRAIETLETGEEAVVTSVPDRGAVERAEEAGAAVGVEDVGDRIERALAAVVERVCDERSLDGLLLTGGAVAVRVLRELDASAIRLTGETIERGVPIGRIRAGRAESTTVITKAGGFGDERTIANCLARLGEENEWERRGP